jgi:hypothetical protein
MRIAAIPHSNGVSSQDKGLSLSAQDKVEQTGDPIDQYLSSQPFNAISRREAASMMNFFADKMHDQGHPWRLFTSETTGAKPKQLHELDAIKRLEQGKAVEFRPYMSRQMELTTDSIDELSPAGALGSGYEPPPIGETVANPGFLGLEHANGKSTVVHNLAELKLMHQLYAGQSPEEQQNLAASDREISDAVKNLSTFARSHGTTSWRFLDQADRPSTARLGWDVVKGSVGGMALGAALGGIIGAPISMWTGSWMPFKGLTAAGAAVFTALKGKEAYIEASKGSSLNGLETLHRLADHQEVTIQRTQLRSVGLPVIGKITSFNDYGQAATISSLEDLQTLAEIHQKPVPKATGKQH